MNTYSLLFVLITSFACNVKNIINNAIFIFISLSSCVQLRYGAVERNAENEVLLRMDINCSSHPLQPSV